MSVFCACEDNATNGNTGKTGKALELKLTAAYFLVATVDNQGNKNVINKSDFVNGVLPESYIKEKVNSVDNSKRWFPVIDVRSATNEREDPVRQTFDEGQNSRIVREGVRTITAMLLKANEKYQANLEKLACEFGLSFFIIDDCGSLGGEKAPNDETVFRPRPIAKDTFYPKLMPAQGSEGQTLSMTFEVDQKSKDSKGCIIPSSSIESELLYESGLLNLLVDYSSVTNSSFTATLALEYGGFGSNIPQPGLIATDFVLKD